MRAPVRVAVLVALWLLAWGEASLANLLSGIAIAGAILVAFPPERPPEGGRRLRLVGGLRLAAYVAVQLVVSNAVMARQLLRLRLDARPGVLVHRLRDPSPEAVTLMTTVISLSPGTMVVDVDRDSTTIAVHVFRLLDVETARASLERLDALVSAALTPAAPPPAARVPEPSPSGDVAPTRPSEAP